MLELVLVRVGVIEDLLPAADVLVVCAWFGPPKRARAV